MEQQSLSAVEDGFRQNRDVILALGNETRQAILITLLRQSQGPGMRVGEIERHTHLSRPAVSHQLKVLKEAGIVDVHREGTKNYYRLNAIERLQALRNLVDSILSQCE